MNYNIYSKYFKLLKKDIILVITTIVFTSIMILSLGKAIEFLVNKNTGSSDNYYLDNILIILSIISGISISSYFRIFLLNSICEKSISNIRSDIYKNLINISPKYYENNKIADITTRLISDATLITEIITTNLPFAIRYFITFVGGILFLMINNIKLAGFILFIAIIIIFPIIIIARIVKNYSNKAQESISNLANHIEETLSNIKTIKSYQREEYEIDRFNSLINLNKENSINRIKYKAILVALVIFLVSFGVMIILSIGNREIIANKITFGEFSSFIYYSIIVATSIAGLSEITSDIVRLKSSVNRINDLLNIKEYEKENLVNLEDKIESIRFNDLSFSYPNRPDKLVIDKINFRIKSGEKIAIIGASASGKTTIFQLLLKFYDIEENHITINDIDICKISNKSVRSKFAVVSQDTTIFSNTIYENIRYGNLDASFDKIEESAIAAGITLPLNTIVGEKGVSLSGGERQKISIARAFLKEPEILLLDEPTSNLDKSNEEQIQKSFMKLIENKTSIIITHDPFMINWVDKIIIINSGKIEDIGTYNELRSRSEFFKNFINDQMNLNTLFFN